MRTLENSAEGDVKNMKNNGAGYAVRIMSKLIGFVKPMIWQVAAAVMFGIIGFICSFGLGIFGGYALLSTIPDFRAGLEVMPFGAHDTRLYIIAMLICALLRGILHYAEQLFNHFIAFRILAEIRSRVFNAMRALAPAKMETKEKGSMISVITADIELLEVFFAHTISPIMIAFGTGIAIIIFYGLINPYLMLLAILFYLIVGVLIPWQAGKKSNDIGLSLRNDIGMLNGQFLDALRGIKEVIQYNSGGKMLKSIGEATCQISQKQQSLRKQGAAVSGITDGMIVISGIAMLLVSSLLVRFNLINAQEGFIASLTMISTFGPFIALANLGNTLSHTLAAGERVLAILEEEPEVYPVVNGENVEFEGIHINKLAFRYGKKYIIKKFDLDLEKGEILGIQGKSGCGKSTLLKLMMRFWHPERGKICISDVNIERVNTSSLLKNISYMTQQTVLFSGTIAENLKIASKNASIEDMKSAAQKAGILEYIMNLTNQFDTEVAELGDNFSGGERQRLGLARCFLADAPLILLDEPTSNLDSQNEALILKTLYEERAGKTIVLVSHRKSTLAIADRIVMMKELQSKTKSNL